MLFDDVKTCLEVSKGIIKRLSPDSITIKRLKENGGSPDDIIENFVLSSYELLFSLYKKVFKFERLNEIEFLELEHRRCSNLGFFFVNVLSKEFSFNWHHIEWANLVMNNNKFTIVASRDLGKTFFMTVCVSIWRAYRCDVNNKKPKYKQNSGIIYSQTQDMADKKLEEIQNIIIKNPILYAKLYPNNAKNTYWKAQRIVTKTGYDLIAKGFDAATLGYHVHHITLDDILKEEAMYSAQYRKKTLYRFLKVVEPQLRELEGGQMILIGTPQHNEDLLGHIRDNLKDQYVYREYPAIFPNGRICWNKKLSRELLYNKLRTQGSLIFAQEYLCRAVSDQSTIFPYKILNRAKDYSYSYVYDISDFKHYESLLYVASGSDFAMSGSVGADYTSHFVLGVSTTKEIYVLFWQRAKGVNYTEQMGYLKNIDSHFKPDIMAVENNNFQAIFEETYAEEHTFSRIKGFLTTTNKNNKDTGLPGLAILF